MNTVELTNVMRKRVKRGTDFLGVLACDMLPAKRLMKVPAMAIINTHPANKPGEHWLAVYITANRHGYFFDSFGNAPSYKNFPSKIRNFLIKNCATMSHSSKQVQSNLSMTCGQHCVFFLHNMQTGMSYRKFMCMYSENLTRNDAMVCHFVKRIRPILCQRFNFVCVQCSDINKYQ